MRKIFLLLQAAALIFLLVVLPVSCLKDKVSYTYTMRTPVLKTLTAIRASMKTGASIAMEYLSKIYTVGDYIFVNEFDKGIHIIDNRDHEHPLNAAFINIPGNEDMAVRGSTLYADAYGDLVVMDISDPLHATVKKILDNIFPSRNIYYSGGTNPDSILIAIDWIAKDTTVDYSTYQHYLSCSGFSGCIYPLAYLAANPSSSSSSANSAATGTGGSMARFTVVNNYLYTLSSPDLSSFELDNAGVPVPAGKTTVDWTAETLYPFKDKLFVGASNGMYMFDIQNTPATPQPAGQFTHVRSCDPVVADDNYAYVTLSSGTRCSNFTNELDVINIQNINNAGLTKVYSLTHPQGLAKDGNILFICDDTDGLKIYDASDPSALALIKQFKDATTIDVIAKGGLAIVLTKAGIFEYDYADIKNIKPAGMLLTLKI
jgi:hypothetical protein